MPGTAVPVCGCRGYRGEEGGHPAHAFNQPHQVPHQRGTCAGQAGPRGLADHAGLRRGEGRAGHDQSDRRGVPAKGPHRGGADARVSRRLLRWGKERLGPVH